MVRPPIQAASWARSSVAEHLTFNQRVDGSIPSGLTNDLKDLAGPWYPRIARWSSPGVPSMQKSLRFSEALRGR
jgi:hypothetical protein